VNLGRAGVYCDSRVLSGDGAHAFGVLGADSRAFAVFDTCFAPLTEEPAKLWLLLVPAFVGRLRKENAPGVAMAIGLGFGLGEAWAQP
jgi:hypothetical protein